MIQKIVVCLMMLFVYAPAYAVPTLNSGPATISSSTVSFPIILTNSVGTSISGITADIVFNSDNFTVLMDGSNLISATAGAATTASGKQMSQNNPRDGVLHIVIIDLAGKAPIADGIVAQVSFSIIMDAVPGNYTFAIVPTATDPEGNLVTITSTSGTIIKLPDTISPSVTAFTIPATSSTLTVPVSAFTATDNIAVTGYLLSESAAKPQLNNPGWLASPPTNYKFTSQGSKTLYAFAKDAAGNISSAVSETTTIISQSAPQFTVTPTNGSGYTILPPTPQVINNNGATSFTVTPAPGYGILSVGGCGGGFSGNTYTTGTITSDCKVSVTTVARTGAAFSISDALNALQAIVGINQLNATDKIRYDVAPLGSSGSPIGNGVIDAADVIIILRRSIGIGAW